MNTAGWLSIFFWLLSIVLIILGAVIHGSITKLSGADTDKTNAKNSATGIIVLGLLFFVGSSFTLYNEYTAGTLHLYYY